MLVIDAHTHMFSSHVRENPALVQEEEAAFYLMFGHGKSHMAAPGSMLSEMDDAGVDMAVLCPFPWMTLKRCAENNDFLLDAAAAHPGRFLPFAVTNPVHGPEAIAVARRALEGGARGLGELHPLPQGFDVNDERLMAPLVDLVREFDVPLMIHVNEPVGHTYVGKGPVTPQIIYRFIRTFPGVKLILPHWGGGLPFYELMPEVAEACSDVCYDSAASPYLYRGDIYRLAAAASSPRKILFATDYPLLPYERTLADAREGIGDPSLEEEIMGLNAARLLGIDPPT
jgi:predicted TIM-barrel fold metal-dependent hydrolase